MKFQVKIKRNQDEIEVITTSEDHPKRKPASLVTSAVAALAVIVLGFVLLSSVYAYCTQDYAPLRRIVTSGADITETIAKYLPNGKK